MRLSDPILVYGEPTTATHILVQMKDTEIDDLFYSTQEINNQIVYYTQFPEKAKYFNIKNFAEQDFHEIIENIYPKELEKRLSVKKLNHSLFDLFIANYTNQMPSFDDEYYFLPDIQPTLNQEKLKLNIKRFNEMLAYENLLINKDDVIPSLKSIFADSVKKILKAEANEETIRLKDTEIYNRNFHYLVIAEFVINASFIYKRKDIENSRGERMKMLRPYTKEEVKKEATEPSKVAPSKNDKT